MKRTQVAGYAICQPTTTDYPDMGWVDSLGVRRPWRRQGLALALLHHIFGEFYRRGRKKVGLGVDASSLTGATRLDERAGMVPFREYTTYEKELRTTGARSDDAERSTVTTRLYIAPHHIEPSA